MEDLGKLLKQYRKKRGMTQAELAALEGMSRATVSGIENNTIIEVGARKLEKLLLAVGLRLSAEPDRRPTTAEVVRMRVHD